MTNGLHSTVFELYVVELFREVFSQLRNESPVKLLDFSELTTRRSIRSVSKEIFLSSYRRSEYASSSLNIRLIFAYNFLKTNNLIPLKVTDMIRQTFNTFYSKFQRLFIRNNRKVHRLFFNCPCF